MDFCVLPVRLLTAKPAKKPAAPLPTVTESKPEEHAAKGQASVVLEHVRCKSAFTGFSLIRKEEKHGTIKGQDSRCNGVSAAGANPQAETDRQEGETRGKGCQRGEESPIAERPDSLFRRPDSCSFMRDDVAETTAYEVRGEQESDVLG
ncbi:unnamed protein product [Caenorhabditis auriculariae]|uniref:Uncharacterized protein n=1 Tax=Caenorhabditis auriculariae TaxID=2777116 RepID=A0A8S1HN87_9PELO|nr:unnamed protein product [Caenorhabditis auriculariae]